MVKAEFGVIIATIMAMYPNAKTFEDPKTAEVWYQLLSDCNAQDLMLAVKEHAKQNKFPPSVAELREGIKVARILNTWEGMSKALQDKRPVIETAVKPEIRKFETIDELTAACGTDYTLAELEHVLLLQAERIHKDESLRKADAGLLEQKAGDM